MRLPIGGASAIDSRNSVDPTPERLNIRFVQGEKTDGRKAAQQTDNRRRAARAQPRDASRGRLSATADFDKPIVGVANGHTTITPCNVGPRQRSPTRAEAAVRGAGAMPQMFGTTTVTDGIAMGTEGMKYSLVSREVIADCIETACSGQWMDGVLAIGGCDKNMPGAMMAIARMNVPAIFVYGGTIKPGHCKGQDLTIVCAFEAVGAVQRAAR